MTPNSAYLTIAAVFAALALLVGLIAPFAPLGLAPLVIVGAVAAAGIAFARGQGLGAFAPSPILAASALLILGLLSAVWALDPAASLRAMGGLGAALISGALLLALACRLEAANDSRQRLAVAILGGTVLLAALLLVEYGSNGAIRRFIAGLAGDAGQWQASMLNRGTVIMCLLIWPALLAARHLRMRGLLIALPAAALALAVTSEQVNARMAMIAGLLGASLAYWIGRPVANLVGGGAIALSLLFPLLPARLPLREQVEAWFPALRFSVVHRFEIWRFSADRIAEKPWLGWGLDMARQLPGGSVTFSHDAKFMPNHPHNGVLHVWLELGLAGALILVLIQFLVWRSIASPGLDRWQRATSVGLYATILVYFLVSFGVWQNWWIATLGLAGAMMILAVRTMPAAPTEP